MRHIRDIALATQGVITARHRHAQYGHCLARPLMPPSLHCDAGPSAMAQDLQAVISRRLLPRYLRPPQPAQQWAVAAPGNWSR